MEFLNGTSISIYDTESHSIRIEKNNYELSLKYPETNIISGFLVGSKINDFGSIF